MCPHHDRASGRRINGVASHVRNIAACGIGCHASTAGRSANFLARVVKIRRTRSFVEPVSLMTLKREGGNPWQQPVLGIFWWTAKTSVWS